MRLATTATRSLAIGTMLLAGGCGPAEAPVDTVRNAPVEVIVADAIDIRGDKGVYVNGDAGVRTRIDFPIPADRVNIAYFHDVERIGASGRLVAVLDTYGSRGDPGRCADGRESWLRIFSLAARRQVEAIPVESCVDGIRAGDPPVTWRADGFDIGGTRPRRYAIEGDRILRSKGQDL